MDTPYLQPSSLMQHKQHAKNIIQVLSLYGFITDSYIIEFFTDNLWEKLPDSWRSALSGLSSPELADELLSNKDPKTFRSVWPLSLLTLKAAAHYLAFSRIPLHEADNTHQKMPPEFQSNCSQSCMLAPLFRKHVKPKKQHEIRQLGKLVNKLKAITACDQVVDIGSGQGHLSRFLSFGQGLSVTAVEADKNLVTMAIKFDQHLMYMLQKEKERSSKNDICQANNIISAKPPRHVLAWVDPMESWEDLLMKLDYTYTEQENMKFNQAGDLSQSVEGSGETVLSPEKNRQSPYGFNDCHNFNMGIHSSHFSNSARTSVLHKFLLTGLHACGDLSVAMLRHFARCPSVVGITSVACCYMKISTPELPQPPGVLSASHLGKTTQPVEYGYPMSSWVAQLPGHKLSYKAREVACHAIEDYTERLQNESTILRTHCYRAVLETVIRSIDPTMKRAGVQTIKKAHELPFKEYARLGLKRVGLDPDTPLNEASVEHMLSQHQNVIAFFTLALLLAPLVETLILLDRIIYLQEEGFHCELIPLFKPKFSPRNLVLVAAKKDNFLHDLLEEIKASDVSFDCI
ncbi:methyltransferase-like protein 25B [Bombina bombina]|uniref:methyltransferase-like protein 25B n=1 Tax=Bombina bombina TaxID=8345 RepID=UPI00235A73F9|nr:methyltransferase-like protein 25B [Bombina bombina]XP_053561254.1 methyltransferase-like protein 25B [Bombina bombina]XP_053561257.1 methyltransferase-like protein 25B [Bombina bombina]XP_053561259.1 methyltransferase-like protein 25B [Bombina bombina]XP_053561262.1 methyltransferase-like protein 25B [Bombina bombina]XP_053561266.1 methyltransferase-like protein 25B [Bombina bombina]XP_053561271.1 methyltransferase-like protein 25B [Bombina bombina]